MLVNVCIAKLHRATVTDADLNYVGSIAIDELLLQAAGLLPGQMDSKNKITKIKKVGAPNRRVLW